MTGWAYGRRMPVVVVPGEASGVPRLLDAIRENPLLLVIAACEIGFWLILAAGLVTRYVLRWRRISTVLLICTPVVDVILLVATAVDLRSGGTAGFAHGLSAAYLGFSIAFGHSMVRWADQRFAHRFAGGPPAVKPPKYGPAKVRYEWREWGKCLLAWLIACGILLLLAFVIGRPGQTEALLGWIGRLTTPLVIWFVIGPLWTTLSPPRQERV
jgi:hypothetical protein